MIDFKERDGNKFTIYKMYSIVSSYGKQIGTQNLTQTMIQNVPQMMTQRRNIHKTKKLKLETIKNKILLTQYQRKMHRFVFTLSIKTSFFQMMSMKN